MNMIKKMTANGDVYHVPAPKDETDEQAATVAVEQPKRKRRGESAESPVEQ